jgi:hypothetical protein
VRPVAAVVRAAQALLMAALALHLTALHTLVVAVAADRLMALLEPVVAAVAVQVAPEVVAVRVTESLARQTQAAAVVAAAFLSAHSLVQAAATADLVLSLFATLTLLLLLLPQQVLRRTPCLAVSVNMYLLAPAQFSGDIWRTLHNLTQTTSFWVSS